MTCCSANATSSWACDRQFD